VRAASTVSVRRQKERTMDIATTLSPRSLEQATRTMGWARAVEYGTTARTVEHLRWAPRVGFAVIAFLSVWGAAGIFGSLAGLQ
jgi:hypothetical protein